MAANNSVLFGDANHALDSGKEFHRLARDLFGLAYQIDLCEATSGAAHEVNLRTHIFILLLYLLEQVAHFVALWIDF